MLQLFLDCPETPDHDVLTDSTFTRLVFLFTVITTRRNHHLVRMHILTKETLGITNQQHCKHINLLRIQFFQCASMHFLFRPSCLTNIADRRLSTTLLQKYLFQPIQLPIPAMTLRIINGCYEISHCCSPNSSFNQIPRCHQIRQ